MLRAAKLQDGINILTHKKSQPITNKTTEPGETYTENYIASLKKKTVLVSWRSPKHTKKGGKQGDEWKLSPSQAEPASPIPPRKKRVYGWCRATSTSYKILDFCTEVHPRDIIVRSPLASAVKQKCLDCKSFHPDIGPSTAKAIWSCDHRPIPA